MHLHGGKIRKLRILVKVLGRERNARKASTWFACTSLSLIEPPRFRDLPLYLLPTSHFLVKDSCILEKSFVYSGQESQACCKVASNSQSMFPNTAISTSLGNSSEIEKLGIFFQTYWVRTAGSRTSKPCCFEAPGWCSVVKCESFGLESPTACNTATPAAWKVKVV